MRRSHLLLPSSSRRLVASPGCGGGSTVWATGKLLKGGTQYVPPKDQLVTITFIAIESQDPSGKSAQAGEPYQAEYDQASGAFTVPGPDRQGIPPGKYRVAVTQKLNRAAYDAANPKSNSKPKKRSPRPGCRYAGGQVRHDHLADHRRGEPIRGSDDRPGSIIPAG